MKSDFLFSRKAQRRKENFKRCDFAPLRAVFGNRFI